MKNYTEQNTIRVQVQRTQFHIDTPFIMTEFFLNYIFTVDCLIYKTIPTKKYSYTNGWSNVSMLLKTVTV